MSIQDLIDRAGEHSWALLIAFVVPPALALLLPLLHGRRRGGLNGWKYAYSVLVYTTCVPGIFAAVISAYALFFLRANLLEVNVLAYLLPLVSMVVTLALIRRQARFDDIPGFDRLWGLMVLLAVSFAIALAITKTRLFVFFGGSVLTLLVLAAIAFALLKSGLHALLGRRGKSETPQPPIPSDSPAQRQP